MKSLIKLLLSNTSKDTLTLFVGSFASSVLAIIFTILFGRWLGPENLALGSAIISFVAIGNAIGDLGLGASLFRFFSKNYFTGKQKLAERILSGIFTIRLVSAAILFTLVLILSSVLAQWVHPLVKSREIIIAGFAIGAFLLVDFQIYTYQSKKKFLSASLTLVATNLLRLILLIILYLYSRLSLTAVLLVYAVSPFIVFTSIWLKNKTAIVGNVNSLKLQKKFVPFAGWVGFTRVLGAINGRVDTLLLLQQTSVFSVGIYSAARQLSFGVPIALGSFAAVLTPRFSSLTGKQLKSYFYKSIGLSIVVSFFLLLGIGLAPFVISMFGPKYTDSRQVLIWLLAGYIPFVLAIPSVNFIIYSLGKPKIIALTTLIQLPVVFVVIVYLSPLYGLYSAVAANFIINLLIFTVSYVYVLPKVSKL